ncbi:hypothetical protein M885DRAFT_505785 [Pelagophyceae sp. CCMP2097]|nr:hypothetical protein M885DRAFT_505785 [Pelagophyceae sp. CCMP2097]|mmetsp:Transcript_27803/g.93473  ORF Transcript_27803/g.93473 Transcript_27803/m.93473 type:complete len:248 (-) Transcript_27803:15-758(-)
MRSPALMFMLCAARQARLVRGLSANSKKVLRPSKDDVTRISFGKPSKSKGVGSRGVPHRLNEEERLLFDAAKKRGYVTLGGSAWRSQRRDAPLVNTWRSWCDAVSAPSILVHKSNAGEGDTVVLDLSPLRAPEDYADHCREAREDVIAGNAMELTDADADEDARITPDEDEWVSSRIYQLPRRDVVWRAPTRGIAKDLAAALAMHFAFPCAEQGPRDKDRGDRGDRGDRAPDVKSGKGRRSGGYGIG